MAINENLPGVEVSIIIDCQPVKEYTDETELLEGPHAAKTVLKYIESVSDATFEIRFSVGPACSKEHSLRFFYFLDGIEATSSYVSAKEDFPEVFDLEGWESGLAAGNQQRYVAFKFSEIKIDDEADADAAGVHKGLRVAQHLGEIVIVVCRVKDLEEFPIEAGVAQVEGQNVFDKPKYTLPEKALKGRGITHGISHGGLEQGVQGQIMQTVEVVDVDQLDNPLAIYKFRYRSRAALKAASIIDEFEDMSADELRRRARKTARNERLAAQNTKAEVKSERGMKRERHDDEDREPVDLTVEKPKGPKVEIDLTED